MIDLHTYFLFIGAVVVLVVVPGPDMAYMLARTIAQGRTAGFLAAAGINVGAYVHVIASVIGLSAILAASSVAFSILKWLGVCYLVWIGFRALTSKVDAVSAVPGATTELPKKTIFWQGFWSDVLNPKVSIFFFAFLPQFVNLNHPTTGVTQQLLLLGVTCNVVAICINLLLVYFASAMTDWLRRSQSVVAWLHKAMGSLFIVLGLRLASDKL